MYPDHFCYDEILLERTGDQGGGADLVLTERRDGGLMSVCPEDLTWMYFKEGVRSPPVCRLWTQDLGETENYIFSRQPTLISEVKTQFTKC